jgi:hypothetical protein
MFPVQINHYMLELSLRVFVQLPKSSEPRERRAWEVTEWASKGSYDITSEHESAQGNDEGARGGIKIDLMK